MKKITVISLLGVLLASCNMSVNKSIRIEDRETVNHSLNTVNGSIHIGNSCEVFGDCRTINGSIAVGTNSRVTDLKTVNGSIVIDENVHVEGSLESINGDVRCQQNVIVNRGIGTINGEIDLAEVTDEFSYQELMEYEGLGFCQKGEGGKLLDSGQTRLTGRLPVNPSGGALSGCPHTNIGMARIFEVVLQLRGEARDRQVEGAKAGLAHLAAGPCGQLQQVMILGTQS